MFGLRVDFLTGRFAASAYNDRDRAEWPPHPARLFSALVATWGEGDPAGSMGDLERAALQWLETLPAPTILADPTDKVAMRSVTDVFVPVNDATVIGLRAKDAASTVVNPSPGNMAAAMAVLPQNRGRQARTFPVAIPEHPVVAFVWNEIECPEVHSSPLRSLLARVVRVGHSSSLVCVTLASHLETEALKEQLTEFVPDDVSGKMVIRWVGAGQFDALVEAHSRHRETEPRVLPKRDVTYRVGAVQLPRALARSSFSPELIVLAREAGPRLPITAAAGLASQFRRAFLSQAEEPIDPLLSGHNPDGSPLAGAHVAFVPLPVVGGAYADGALIGIAIAVPEAAGERVRAAVLRTIERMHDVGEEGSAVLRLGAVGKLQLRHDPWTVDTRVTLQSDSWTRPSRHWASVTPVALDRNPGDLHHANPAKRAAAFAEATAAVVNAVQDIGLPTPSRVDVVRSTVVSGSAKPRMFPRFPLDPKRTQRVLVHVRLEFDEPVLGPVILGAGRYFGLGLLTPLDTVAGK